MSNMRKSLLSFAGFVAGASAFTEVGAQRLSGVSVALFLITGALGISTILHLVSHAEGPCTGCERLKKEVHTLRDALTADAGSRK